MARPKLDTKRPPTTDRILAAAESAFAEHGFGGARLEDIAQAAGIRRPSLLYHFKTKEQLYGEVVQRAFARLGEVLFEVMAQPGGLLSDRVDALVARYVDFLQERRTFAPLILREIIDGQGPGRELILSLVPPLLDQIEAFCEEHGGLPQHGIPPRAVLMQLATGALVREASGPLRKPLWGDGDALPLLARLLVSEEET